MKKIFLYIGFVFVISTTTNFTNAYEVSPCFRMTSNFEDCTVPNDKECVTKKMRFDYEVDGLKVIFKGEVSSDYKKVIWDFGDDNTKEFSLKDMDSLGEFSHKYTKTGTYNFTITTIFESCTDTRRGTIYAFDFKD